MLRCLYLFLFFYFFILFYFILFYFILFLFGVFLKPNRILLEPIGEDISMYILYAKAILFFAFDFYFYFFQKPESKFVQYQFSFSPKIQNQSFLDSEKCSKNQNQGDRY